VAADPAVVTASCLVAAAAAARVAGAPQPDRRWAAAWVLHRWAPSSITSPSDGACTRTPGSIRRRQQ